MLFVSVLKYYLLLAFLALPSAEGANVKKCVVDVKLSKPCTFQECQPLCLLKYNGNGFCPGNDNNICACVYNC
ncbi:hypothetical protein AtEden1_Chr4g0287761 [Arabidopsis thaliana]